MRPFASLRSFVSTLFHRAEIDREIDEELRSHIQHRADDLERGGLPRAEAESRARIEFGGYQRLKEESREALGGQFGAGLLQDIRFALRRMAKKPGFAVVAILTLAFAIGANAVVFAVLNAFILRPLNVPQSESLYGLWRLSSNDMAESYPDYLDLRDRNHSFESLAAYNVMQAALDTGNDPSRAWVDEATGNYFDALGLKPYLGRFFHGSDEHGPNSAPYIVLTYDFWHSHFQGDPGVIGRVVRLNKFPYTIIGVGPPEFHGTLMFFNPDFFVPIVNHAQFDENDLNNRGDRWVFMTLGHLKAGVTPAQAIADLNSVGASLEKAYPKDDPKMSFKLARPGLYGDYIGRPVRTFMTALMLLAGLILLAACANLGSLFAARAADRSREIALRLALGSSRKRILRGLFAEAVLISLVGGAVGLAGSVVLLRALSVWQPISRWPLHMSVNPDVKVYAVALFLALASGLLFGAVPVGQVLRTDPYEAVKGGSVETKRGRFGLRMSFRDLLLVVQIAICAVLVTSSIVAVRGLAHSLHNNFGFELQNTMLVETDLNMAGYRGDKVPPMQKRMIDALAAIPGVESVGLADQVPLGDAQPDSNVFADSTTDLRPANAASDALMFKVSPEYFQAAGTALVSGRAFTWQENRDKPRVAVVNRQFARKIFGSEAKAMGAYFKMPDGARIQVVGMAEDGKYASLTEDPQPVMFLPILQSPSNSAYLVVRSSRDPEQLAQAIRDTLRNMDAGLPVYIQTRYKALDAFLFGPRMATISLGVLGVMGAMLSVVGIFGMASYSVSKRLREFGIRIALGAQKKELLHAALGRTFRLLAFGSAVGLLLGLAAGKVIAFIVSQATPWDPIVLGGVLLTMLFLGLLAGCVPARRALGTDPLILLREE
ncbi:ABC transporter permease [Tunturiibacter gelidoferens]|uniref:Putative permease n=1 Tax=Tunturiibacter lichenicola TaxID=2051959 RepID=A0A7Y9T490_9BACT|nr:ABC transporter permease [Edaphobacter lichenicola]NYF53743.1 putative permease [Edaphobacter lichenicola]